MSPTSICIFVRVRRKIQCLLFLSHCRAFFCLSIFSLLRLSLFYSEFFTDILSVILSSRLSVRCFLRIDLFYLFSAQLLRSLGGSFMKMELIFQYGYGIMICKEKRFVFHNKSRFIKEDMDETVFMFALFKCRKFDKRRN